MDISTWILWSVLAALLLITEMMSGTFYLLVAACGALMAAMLAYAGLSGTVQLAACGAVCLCGFFLLWKFKPMTTRLAAAENPDVNPDIGQRVIVTRVDPDGRAFASYRGAVWEVRSAEKESLQAQKTYVIQRVEGSVFVLLPLDTNLSKE